MALEEEPPAIPNGNNNGHHHHGPLHHPLEQQPDAAACFSSADCANDRNTEDDNNGGTLPPNSHRTVLFQEAQAPGDDTDDDVPISNERLLGTAFVSFMTFALTQLLFAYIAGSEAMMGDSAAMIVDALTYLFNYCAERRKHTLDRDTQHLDPRIRQRTQRKWVLQMEIVPPILSVTTLVLVTCVVTKKALYILQLDLHRNVNLQKRPNVQLMLIFSLFNLALDGLNVFCFARAKHLMGYATTEPHDDDDNHDNDEDEEQNDVEESNARPSRRRRRRRNSSGEGGGEYYKQVRNNSPNSIDSNNHLPAKPPVCYDVPPQPPKQVIEEAGMSSSSSQQPFNHHNKQHDCANNSTEDETDEDPEDREHANLNMCSAYTHVFADTLRSIAVIIAAGLAELFPSVTTPEEADATAAVVVSVLILLSLIPLMQGLRQSVSELRAILAEERSETMFLQAAAVGTAASSHVGSSLELT